MSEAKIRTLVVTAYWNEGNPSEIPDEVKFPNDDEHYLVTIKQSQPHFECCIDLIKVMNGYIYGGTKRRRRNNK